MIRVDESDPVGDIEPTLPYHDVTIKRGIDAKEFYDIIEEVGRGKFGIVYKCREKSTGLELAAKFIPIPKRGDRRNVEREVEIMNSLQHSKIIQLYDAYEFSQNIWVILELIDGGELFERVIDDNYLLTEKACTVILRQVCEAIEFIHRNSILHLDLKPENILCLTREGNRIKIIDFGLARKYDPDKKLQVLFGTPEFVAPEVVNFDRISYGTDMWSIGVICYVLLSGLSPFMGETDVETMTNVTIAKYDYDDDAFNDISPEALDFIAKLLVKDINGRMTSAECLEHTYLKRKFTRPQLAPKPSTIPPPKFINFFPSPLPAENGDVELEKTKENLKEFVERWGEHPNSPYVFDMDAHLAVPVHIDVKASSNLSSRGCSPSPCESLTSTNEKEDISSTQIEPNKNSTTDSQEQITNNINNFNNSIMENNSEMNNQISPLPKSPDMEDNEKDKNIKEYLQSFDRRNSDSKFIMKENGNIMEKINLADEIKKLSDRLLMLSKINVDIGTSNDDDENNNNHHQNGDLNKDEINNNDKESVILDKINDKPEILKKPDIIKSKLNECFNRSVILASPSSTASFSNGITNGHSVIKSSTRASVSTDKVSSKSSSKVNGCISSSTLTKSSKFSQKNKLISTSVDEMQENSLSSQMSRITRFKSGSAISSSTMSGISDNNATDETLRRSFFQTSRNSTFSQTFTNGENQSRITANNNDFGNSSLLSSSLLSNRRTKFRINQQSRDVPLDRSNSSHSAFILENSSAATTKDCLLQLLDKYHHEDRLRAVNKTSSISNIGRHQSISMDYGISDNLENRSMNSINAFFHRHSTRGTAVKSIQKQIESRNSH